MKKLLYLLMLGFICSSCVNEIKKNSKEEKVEIPSDATPILYSGHLYFKSKIDSLEPNLLFDTGADKLYLDSTYYSNNSFQFKNVIDGYVPGAGNSLQRIQIVLDEMSVEFAGLSFVSAQTPILKLKPIVGDIADGIMGYRLFSDKIMELNYENEYMRMYSSIDSFDLSGYEKIPLKIIDNRYFVSLSVQVIDSLEVTGDFLLDFGSGGSISFTSQTAKDAMFSELIDYKETYYTKYGGIGGESSSCDFRSENVKIGSFELSNFILDYSLDKKGALSKRNYLGILGNDVLERFDVILDNINHVLYLKPNKSFQKPSEFSKSGFGISDRRKTMNAWIVNGLYKEGNAEKAGLLIDDQIIKVNQVSIHDIPFKQRYKALVESEELNLEIKRNNDIMKLTFKLDHN